MWSIGMSDWAVRPHLQRGRSVGDIDDHSPVCEGLLAALQRLALGGSCGCVCWRAGGPHKVFFQRQVTSC